MSIMPDWKCAKCGATFEDGKLYLSHMRMHLTESDKTWLKTIRVEPWE